MLNNLCIIASGYPSEYSVVNAFVETLVNALVDSGVRCTVIAPQSLTRVLAGKEKKLPYHRVRYTPAGNQVTVITPRMLSFSAQKLGALNTAELTYATSKAAVERAFADLAKEQPFDAVYGHFIYPSGLIANDIGKKYGIPAFFAYGENTTYTIDRLGEEKTRELLHGITGVVSVSSENRRVLIEKNMVPAEIIDVFPNAVDTDCFYPRDRSEMRQKLGFPKDAFIVAFVGRFLDVKGPDRLSAAIEQLNDDNIYPVFIGDGPLKPICRNILHCGPLQHDEIPEYLSAADVFVLPTKAEGCCNAIIEAMACGLPIVSSDLPFNEDILNEDYAVFIDPEKINAIAAAISDLKNDEIKRTRMANTALKKGEELSISKRADLILSFLNQRTNNFFE